MENGQEKVIIVGVETEENQRYFEESMTELSKLTMTASGKVVFTLTQKRPQVDRQTIIGKGKLQELIQQADAYEADLIIFNHEMTPRQSQLVGEAVGLPVIDRVQLILDIFAMRARSKEGKLQVELAQLEYLLPRLAGQGKSMSRLGGGIGTRGPGETKLETDRRHIRNKILGVKRELKAVEAHRERSRQKRQMSEVFQIGLIGYTNAGKSTILNLLTQADTYSKDQLFATLDPLTKKWRFAEGFEITVTDTVGFIQDLPTQLIDAFHSTLEESQNMDLLLHVVDASSPDRTLQEQTVLQLMEELKMNEMPILTVYNKADQIDPALFTPTLFPNVLISAQSVEGKDQLIAGIKRQLMELLEPYTLLVASDEGQKLSALRRQTLVLSEHFIEAQNSYEVRGFAKKTSKWLKME
ncbi:GTPase HflX [Enterococcus durans]|uniref:GTPase HflX n=1 Tax=Enterococcus durans TaxID=53345 RepID=A0A5N0YZ57_9ENTE|nr:MULTISPECIES: GTPase HflX [Enterococcus]KAA9181137.1 GTPase HflX [Enterococcus durans]KAA9188347.1 GTPase HflX [Enterococcus durans]KAA9188763.1 GTPase HflX [Enterococcus durans]KAA9194733.1 GTPase HflX [Enterococcus durans]KAA9195818.1 GTPase HflX [Enterococcus durans]